MQNIRKSLSTQIRERLADPVFFLLLLGFIFFFFAFVTDFEAADILNLLSRDTKATATIPEDINKYVGFIYENRTQLIAELKEMDTLLDNRNIQSNEWKEQMKAQTEIIMNLCNQGIQAQPPEKYESFHKIYSLSLMKYKEAAEYLDPGYDNYIFSSDFEDARKLRQTADKYFSEAFANYNMTIE